MILDIPMVDRIRSLSFYVLPVPTRLFEPSSVFLGV